MRALALGRVVAVALAVAACATPGTRSVDGGDIATLPAGASFDVTGRLSARRGTEGVAAHFGWSHTPDGDRIDITTPLGPTVARLTGNAEGVRIERPDQPNTSYPDWKRVTEIVLGVAIPVDGLAAWIVGKPAVGSPFDLERDTIGRPLVLRQSGWEIVYGYTDSSASAALPARLVMRYPDVEPIDVRIAIDRWRSAASAP